MLEKIALLRHTIEENDFSLKIEVDGGINEETASLVREAGADILVAGSAIYGANNIENAIRKIRG